MRSRFNGHNNDPLRRQFPSPHQADMSSHCILELSRFETGAQREESGQTRASDARLHLHDEVSPSELNDFTLSCIEQLCSLNNKTKIRQVISKLLSEKLPSYVTLKTDFRESRAAHQKHHLWTQKMYQAVEPLLQFKSAPLSEQQTLGNLALQCVEQDMQLHYRMEQLHLRIAHVERSVAAHTKQLGADMGLPEKVMSKVVKVIMDTMKNFG